MGDRVPERGPPVRQGSWYTHFLANAHQVRPSNAACDELCDRVDGHVRDGAYALPILPEVASEALQLSHDPDVALDRMVDRLERDPVISARLLATANSPLYRGSSPFQSLQQVIVRLGFREVRDMIVQVALMTEVFVVPRFKPRMMQLRTDAIGVAHACRWLEMVSPRTEEWAFIGGLTRDLGKVTILAILAQQAEPQARDPAIVEELLAIRHAAVGAVVAERLRLPEPVVRAIARHHDFDTVRVEDRLPVLVAAGELLWHAVLQGTPEGRKAFATAPATRSIGLDPAWADRLVDRMVELVPACVAEAH